MAPCTRIEPIIWTHLVFLILIISSILLASGHSQDLSPFPSSAYFRDHESDSTEAAEHKTSSDNQFAWPPHWNHHPSTEPPLGPVVRTYEQIVLDGSTVRLACPHAVNHHLAPRANSFATVLPKQKHPQNSEQPRQWLGLSSYGAGASVALTATDAAGRETKEEEGGKTKRSSDGLDLQIVSSGGANYSARHEQIRWFRNHVPLLDQDVPSQPGPASVVWPLNHERHRGEGRNEFKAAQTTTDSNLARQHGPLGSGQTTADESNWGRRDHLHSEMVFSTLSELNQATPTPWYDGGQDKLAGSEGERTASLGVTANDEADGAHEAGQHQKLETEHYHTDSVPHQKRPGQHNESGSGGKNVNEQEFQKEGFAKSGLEAHGTASRGNSQYLGSGRPGQASDSWHISEGGELVLQRVSARSAGRYTCLYDGRQSELILDVMTDINDSEAVGQRSSIAQADEMTTRRSRHPRTLSARDARFAQGAKSRQIFANNFSRQLWIRPPQAPQPKLPHLIESEIVSDGDLEAIPGLVYTKQQLFCPLMGHADLQLALQQQMDLLARRFCMPNALNHPHSELTFECIQLANQLIVQLLGLPTSASDKNMTPLLATTWASCYDSSGRPMLAREKEKLFRIAWYKDGRELAFNPDGRAVDRGINIKLINFLDQFKLSTNGPTGNENKAPVEEGPASEGWPWLGQQIDMSNSVEASSSPLWRGKRQQGEQQAYDQGEGSLPVVLCPPEGLILEIDGIRKDKAGRYTCALKFSNAKLSSLLEAAAASRDRKTEPSVLAGNLTRDMDNSHGESDKSKCCDPEGVVLQKDNSRSQVHKLEAVMQPGRAPEIVGSMGVQTVAAQIEASKTGPGLITGDNGETLSDGLTMRPGDDSDFPLHEVGTKIRDPGAQPSAISEAREQSEAGNYLKNESEKARTGSSANTTNARQKAQALRNLHRPILAGIEHQISNLRWILYGSPGSLDEESLNFIKQKITRRSAPLVLQTFALLVNERPANSCSLWTTINEANEAYSRRKLVDFEKLKRGTMTPYDLTAYHNVLASSKQLPIRRAANLNNLPDSYLSGPDRGGVVGVLMNAAGQQERNDYVGRRSDVRRDGGASGRNGKLAASLSWLDGVRPIVPSTFARTANLPKANAENGDDRKRLLNDNNEQVYGQQDLSHSKRHQTSTGTSYAELNALRRDEAQSVHQAVEEVQTEPNLPDNSGDDRTSGSLVRELPGDDSRNLIDPFGRPDSSVRSSNGIDVQKAPQAPNAPDLLPPSQSTRGSSVEARTNYEASEQTASLASYADEAEAASASRGLSGRASDASSLFIKNAAQATTANTFNYANERNPGEPHEPHARTMVNSLAEVRPTPSGTTLANSQSESHNSAMNILGDNDDNNDDGTHADRGPTQNSPVYPDAVIQSEVDLIENDAGEQSHEININQHGRQKIKRSIGTDGIDPRLSTESHIYSTGRTRKLDFRSAHSGSQSQVKKSLDSSLSTESHLVPQSRSPGFNQHKLPPSSTGHPRWLNPGDKLLLRGVSAINSPNNRHPPKSDIFGGLAPNVGSHQSLHRDKRSELDPGEGFHGKDSTVHFSDEHVPSTDARSVERTGGTLDDDEDNDEDLLWAASQYLYMHIRAFAASSLYGVQVEVEWSNEHEQRVSSSAIDRNLLIDSGLMRDQGSLGKTDEIAPFATIDLVQGQDLHLQCTAQALGRMPEVKWYKRIQRIPESVPDNLVGWLARRISDHMYWPVTHLDLLGLDGKKFISSQTLTIFDNLLNQTFTVINSLKLSQATASEAGSSPVSDIGNAFSGDEHNYNLFSCVIDADVRHDHATLGVQFRETPGNLPPVLRERLRARSLIMDNGILERSRNSQIDRAQLFEVDSSRAAATDYNFLRQNRLLMPFRSAWIPIGRNGTYLDSDSSLALDSFDVPYVMSPTMLTMMIVILTSSLIALVYLTLKSYHALTNFNLDDEDTVCRHKSHILETDAIEDSTDAKGSHIASRKAPLNTLCEFDLEKNSTNHRTVYNDETVQLDYIETKQVLAMQPLSEAELVQFNHVSKRFEGGPYYEAHIHGTVPKYMCDSDVSTKLLNNFMAPERETEFTRSNNKSCPSIPDCCHTLGHIPNGSHGDGETWPRCADFRC